MIEEIFETAAGTIAVCRPENVPLSDASEYLDLLMNSGAETMALRKEHLAPEFFELQTGLAGEMLQKNSTYRRRLVILGDFSDVESGSLRDFIYESNKTGRVVFCPTLEEAAKYLK